MTLPMCKSILVASCSVFFVCLILIHITARMITDAVHNGFEFKSKKSSLDSLVGCKRGSTENWSRAGDSCKRSRPITTTFTISGGTKLDQCGRQRNGESCMVSDESVVGTLSRSDSVLMNLLVSGCDLNAGYVRVNVSS